MAAKKIILDKDLLDLMQYSRLQGKRDMQAFHNKEKATDKMYHIKAITLAGKIQKKLNGLDDYKKRLVEEFEEWYKGESHGPGRHFVGKALDIVKLFK